MDKDKLDFLTIHQLNLAIIKYPKLKEIYVKKFERLIHNKRYRSRIEKLLSDFAYEVTKITRNFDKDDIEKT